MVKGLVHEWETKFGGYRLFDLKDNAATFVNDRYVVKKKEKGARGWVTLNLSDLDVVDAQSICQGFAGLAVEK